MCVDHVVLVDRDDEEIPPTKVIRLHGHPPTEHDAESGVSIQFCEADECAESASFNLLASFYIPTEVLRAALALVLDES